VQQRSSVEPFISRLERLALPYIRGMLDVSSDHIDRPLLEQWIARLGLASEWTQAASRS
jgi:hypothetical protein